jgi:uncharacterized membrane protein
MVIPEPVAWICMRSQVRWGIALIVIGALLGLIIPFFGIPLVVIGIALIVWRGREDTIEEIRE